ncbi:MAG: hypothetical protein M3N16_00380 [Actinomycetota bacterium]|nr:hypothetical protein [Actinomycetota bacterium]
MSNGAIIIAVAGLAVIGFVAAAVVSGHMTLRETDDEGMSEADQQRESSVVGEFSVFEAFRAKLRANFRRGETDAGPELPNAELRRVETLVDELKGTLRNLAAQQRHSSWVTPLVDLLAKDITVTQERVNTLRYGWLQVPTVRLYEEILAVMKEVTPVKIVDQDVFRWNELLDPEDRIRFNTINYSADILRINREASRRPDNPLFLERIFMLDSADPAIQGRRELVAAILEKVRSESPGERLKVYVLDVALDSTEDSERQDLRRSARSFAEELHDFVLAPVDGVNVIFREEITYGRRDEAYKTRSWIVTNPDLAKRAEHGFEVMRRVAVPVAQYLERLTQAGPE